MDLKKASRIVDSKHRGVSVSGESTGGEEVRKFHNFFGGKSRVSDSQQFKDELAKSRADLKKVQDSRDSLRRTVATQQKTIKALKRRVKDNEEKIEEFQQVAQTFKSEKAERESKLLELQTQLEEARKVDMPLKIEYSTVENKLTLGSEEKENVSFEEFNALLTTISAIFPDILVKMTVEEIEEEAHKVKDSIEESKWDKKSLKKFLELCDSFCENPTQEVIGQLTECANKYGSDVLIEKCQGLQPNPENPAECVQGLKSEVAFDCARLQPIADDQTSVQRAANAVEEYLLTFDDTALKQEDEQDLPEGMNKLIDLIIKNGFLTESEYEELAPLVKQELDENNAKIPSLALIKDSRIYTVEQFEEKIKDSSKEIKDAYNSIPGTPSHFRICDSDFRKGFGEGAASIKAGDKYIIFQ